MGNLLSCILTADFSFILIPAVHTLCTFCRSHAYITQSKCVSFKCSTAICWPGREPIAQQRWCCCGCSARILRLLGRSGGGDGGARPPWPPPATLLGEGVGVAAAAFKDRDEAAAAAAAAAFKGKATAAAAAAAFEGEAVVAAGGTAAAAADGRGGPIILAIAYGSGPSRLPWWIASCSQAPRATQSRQCVPCVASLRTPETPRLLPDGGVTLLV
jgi:hypothetical protein